jgi:hypothetical protein
MRGDTPGNFFCSISRFSDQDDLIVVMRNGYGSSEHLEENLQAVLFNQGAPYHGGIRRRFSWALCVLSQIGSVRSGDSGGEKSK